MDKLPGPDGKSFEDTYNIKLLHGLVPPVQPSEIPHDEIKTYKNVSYNVEDIARTVLREQYGLIEHWDYEFLNNEK